MVHKTDPFPGLRPFEPDESSLFFGRDEQCDELLTRLDRRRLVAVVGASGSGKSSLVQAGLLPALKRGYLPAAGSSWQIAVFRPGADPIGNLTDSVLATMRRTTAAPLARESLAALLDSSSLGLVAAARQLLADRSSNLLVVVDQFEEIFRFRDLAAGADAEEAAVNCVQLLLGAVGQDEVPVYVVLTMRSDYLGECAQFAGLPEALNDSQFLVPRMTRDQLRSAIEGPVAVAGGRIAPRLVQRLLYDVDALSGRTRRAAARGTTGEYDHDQLPVLQHALMRVWAVSKATRETGGAIDLDHYERPPVETIHHALDRHAEEVYNGLPSDAHRVAARRVFQQLTDRDWEHREVRRPTSLSQLIAVAAGDAPSPDDVSSIVDTVIDEFSARGRAFVVVNAQQDIDISHESFIRKWARLRDWVQEESQSRQTYVRLAEAATEWSQDRASLYRGPELAEADRWWKRQLPSRAWARRYHPGFDTADRFLKRSRFQRSVRRTAFVAGILFTVGAAVVMFAFWQRAVAAEAEATRAKNVVDEFNVQLTKTLGQLKETLEREARLAISVGDLERAARLTAEVQKAEAASAGTTTLTSGEAREVARYREELAVASGNMQQLQRQYDELNTRLSAVTTETTDLRGTVTKLTQERDNLNADLGAKLKKVSDERDGLKTNLDDVAAQLQASNTANASLAKKLDAALVPPAHAPPALKGDHIYLYERGLAAKSRRQWREAEQYFEAAARQRADTGEPIPLEPSGTEPYVPAYQLGLVRQELACEAWEQAVKSGLIKNNSKEYAALVERHKACTSR